MRICSSCSAEYEFYGQRCSLCRECRRAYDRDYHAKRSTVALERKAALQYERLQTIRDWYQCWKATQSCKFCKESEVACLDLHHTDPTTKEYTVSNIVTTGFSIKKIQKEIDKCIVVCSNCHRKIHAGIISA